MLFADMLAQGAELLATWAGGLMLLAAFAVLWGMVRWRGVWGVLGGAAYLAALPYAVVAAAQGQAAWAGLAMLYLIPWLMAVTLAALLMGALTLAGVIGGGHG